MEIHTEFNPIPEHSEGTAERREEERFYSLAAIRAYMRQTDDLSINALNRTRARLKNSPPREFKEALSALDVKRLAGDKDIDEEEIQRYKILLLDLLTYMEILTRSMDTGLDPLTKEAQQERRERLCQEALEEFYVLPWDLFKTQKGTLLIGRDYKAMPLILMYNSSSQVRNYLLKERPDLPLTLKGGDLEQYAHASIDNFAKGTLHKITNATERIPAERQKNDEPSAIDLYPAATLSPEKETVEALSLAEHKKIIEEVLSRHPRGEQEFRLYMKGYNSQEIAEKLSINEGTAKTHIQRIKDQIRDLAKKCGYA